MNFEDKVLALFDNGRRSAVYVAGYQSARAQAASIAAEADRLIAEMAVENAELREALRETEHFLTQIDPVHWPSKREARRIIGIVRVALASPAAEPEPQNEYGLNPEDLVINGWSSKPAGNWSIGIPRGIQVVHLPTGTVVEWDAERSQHANRHVALTMLAQKLKAGRQLKEAGHE